MDIPLSTYDTTPSVHDPNSQVSILKLKACGVSGEHIYLLTEITISDCAQVGNARLKDRDEFLRICAIELLACIFYSHDYISMHEKI